MTEYSSNQPIGKEWTEKELACLLACLLASRLTPTSFHRAGTLQYSNSYTL